MILVFLCGNWQRLLVMLKEFYVELNSRLPTNSLENSTTVVWKTVINKDVESDF